MCVIRGDHTCCDFYLTVLPANTDAAVFSIDGSFTASVSIMGKDPKVRPGAVDVVRSVHGDWVKHSLSKCQLIRWLSKEYHQRVCLSVYLSVCLSLCLSVCLSVCLLGASCKKTTDHICVLILPEIYLWITKNWFRFESWPLLDLDLGNFLKDSSTL